MLIGEQGKGTFHFDASNTTGFDKIRDFVVGEDILEISGAIAENIRASPTGGGGDTTIYISDDKAFVLKNIDISTVFLDDFSFV